MSYTSVFVRAAAMKSICAEMRKAIFTETGGALVGYLDRAVLIVTAASGPGPRGRFSCSQVMIDGAYAAKFCQRAFRESGGRIDYVGDWHCHLSWVVRPSVLDHIAMKTMAEFTQSNTRHPVSLIRAQWSRRMKAFRYDEKLVPIPHSVEEPRSRKLGTTSKSRTTNRGKGNRGRI
jgi:integrative and conjugative element protein (TIGR02256 family)